MREFNTTGPCHPDLHYTVMRDTLISKGIEKVGKGSYFTIFAPRQTGKTTYFQLLIKKLEKDFIPIWISFENLKTVSKEVFYKAFSHELQRELKKFDVETPFEIEGPHDLQKFFEEIDSVPIVLVIDEFEGIPDCVLSEIMHTFRKMYHKKTDHCFHSLILVGVSTIAELVVSSTSPFNIAEEIEIPYFTNEEVNELIAQYTAESGRCFDKDAVKSIYENTKGQPGLVCALCRHLVTDIATDASRPVTINHFRETLRIFLTERWDKNIINIVRKAREKKEFMTRLLFSENPVEFTVDNPDIAWLYANGVIDKKDGCVDIPVPLYAKRLINAFRPLINGETDHYVTSPHDTAGKYLNPGGGLNVNALLEEYRAYVRRRGFRAFDIVNLKEAACHYSLDGFIAFFIRCIGGETFIEVPSGRGRTDIMILYKNEKHIIETKIFANNSRFQKGKHQLAKYLESEDIPKGYYAVFSKYHTEKDTLYSEEMIGNRMICTYIIPIDFIQPSRTSIPDNSKTAEQEKIVRNMLKMKDFTKKQISRATGVSVERIEQLANPDQK